jgi:hypothetical protein
MIHHVDIQIIEGLSLQGRYSYYEPNIKVEKDEYYQVMGGVNVYPIPFFEVNFQYRHNSEQQPSVNNDELLAHAHVFF